MLGHFQTECKVEATISDKAVFEMREAETRWRNQDIPRVDVFAIQADHIRNTCILELGKPGPSAAPYIYHGLRLQ